MAREVSPPAEALGRMWHLPPRIAHQPRKLRVPFVLPLIEGTTTEERQKYRDGVLNCDRAAFVAALAKNTTVTRELGVVLLLAGWRRGPLL